MKNQFLEKFGAPLHEFVSEKKGSIKRGPFGSTIKKEFFVKSGYKVYEQQNVIKNNLELGTYYIDENKFKELEGFKVEPNDILISCSGTIGKIIELPKKIIPGIINQALLKITLNQEKVSNKYFIHLFRSNLDKFLKENTKGTAIKNITSVKDLKEIILPLPPLPTQKKIASKIDTLFAKIDSGTQSLEKAKRLLEQYRQSVLKHAFEGKLTAKWREENKDKREPASVLLERIKEERKKKLGKKYKELPPVDASKLPELPEGWMWCRLGEMCEKVLRRNSEFKKTFYYIDIGSIDNKKNVILNPKKINAKNAPSRAQQIIREGDILFSTVRTYLKNIAIVPLEYDSQICSTGFCVIRPNEYLNNSLLFLYCLKEGFVNNLSKIQRGTSYPACRDDDVMNEIIPVPPLSEQQIVLNKILKMQNYFNRLLNQQTQVLNYKETLKNSILKSAFEGKLIHD